MTVYLADLWSHVWPSAAAFLALWWSRLGWWGLLQAAWAVLKVLAECRERKEKLDDAGRKQAA